MDLEADIKNEAGGLYFRRYDCQEPTLSEIARHLCIIEVSLKIMARHLEKEGDRITNAKRKSSNN